jgi:DNA-directed RNA polymerase subunit M/transcription elongation factor TFIIS
MSDQGQSLTVDAGYESVEFTTADKIATLPAKEVQDLLVTAKIIELLAKDLDAAKLAQFGAFTNGLQARLCASAPPLAIAVDETQQTMLNLLVEQSRARAHLESRQRYVCQTCGKETLRSPEYQKVKKRNQKIRTGLQTSGVVLGSGGIAAFFSGGMIYNLLGLDPDFVCPYCQSMTAQTSVTVFCPQCKAQRNEAVLKKCKKCGHDFTAGADVERLWQPQTKVKPLAKSRDALIVEMALRSAATAIAWHGAEQRFLLGTMDRAVGYWDASGLRAGGELKCEWAVVLPGPPPMAADPLPNELGWTAVAMSADGRLAAAATKHRREEPSGRAPVYLLSPADGTFLSPLPAEWADNLGSIAFTDDGQLVAIGSHTVQVWDTQTYAPFATLVPSKGNPRRLAFSQDKTLLAAYCERLLFGSPVVIWRTDSWMEVGNPLQTGAAEYVIDLAWVPQTTDLAVATAQVRIVSAEGRQSAQFTFGGSLIERMSVSPQGDCFAVSLRRPTGPELGVQVMDIAAGTKRAFFPSDGRPPCTALAYGPGGLVAVGDYGRSLRVWGVD